MAGLDAAYMYRQIAFSYKTFGPGERTEGVVDHIRKELDEVLANPRDITEWADIIILAIDGAWRVGFEPQEIIEAVQNKLIKNEKREWPDWRTAEPGKAIEHIRMPKQSETKARVFDPADGERIISPKPRK